MHGPRGLYICIALQCGAEVWCGVVKKVSICMVVYHQMDFSPGNNNNANTIGSNSPPPPLAGTLWAVLSAVDAFWCCADRDSEMVNSKDEARSSSRGNPLCKDIRDVMHNVSQQQRIYPISTHLWEHCGSRLDAKIPDIQLSSGVCWSAGRFN